jgi:hypothetical protein
MTDADAGLLIYWLPRLLADDAAKRKTEMMVDETPHC